MTSRWMRTSAWLIASAVIAGGCSQAGSASGLNVLQEIRNFNRPLIESSPSQASTKFRKMQRDLVSFNRGLNHLFYSYVGSVGLSERWMGPLSKNVILHGDFHVENIGAYRAADGRVVVDLIDFDDSFQGPSLLDVYRAASSLYLAVKTDPMREKLVRIFTKSYAKTMQQIASGAISADIVLDETSSFDLVQDLIKEALSFQNKGFLQDFAFCREENGRMVFARSYSGYENAPPGSAQALLKSYLAGFTGQPVDPGFYELQDAVVERGSGVGSAGVYKVRILVRGPSPDPWDDVILEFKQEVAPQGQAFAVTSFADQGQRVLDGERTMQTITPPNLGKARLGDTDFFVSELSPCYRELEWAQILGTRKMKQTAEVAGMLLAKGHARSSIRTGAVAAEISGLLTGNEDRFFKDVFVFCSGYDAFLQKGYEKFSHELTFSPLLFILSRVAA